MGYRDRVFGNSGNYDYLPRAKKSASNQLQELAVSGELENFLDYQNNNTNVLDSLWNALKSGGSSALDLLSRGGYAAGGVMEEVAKGTPENIPARVGTELLSGIGGLKGEKKLPSDVLRENTNYGQFSQEHPIASIGTDFATDVILDPTTYTGGALVKGVGKVLSAGGKGIVKAARTTQTGEKAIDKLGRTFVPRYGLKRGVEKVTGNSGAASLIDDIYYNRELEKRYLEGKYGGRAKEIIKATKNMAPEDISAIERALMEDGVETLPDNLRSIAEEYRALTRIQYGDYAENLMAVGKTPVAARIDYLHNNPKAYADLTNAGDLEHTELNRGLVDKKQGFEKPKLYNTFDEYNAARETKVADTELPYISPENYWKVFQRNVSDLSHQNVQRIFQVRVQDDLLKGMESVGAARKLPLGTRQVWDGKNIFDDAGNIIDRKNLLKKGETLYMPAGNLKFFQQEAVRLNKPMKETLEKYGKYVAGEANNEFGIFMTGDELYDLVKEFPSFTTRVPVYAIPTESAKFMLDASRRLGSPDTVASWWDKLMGTFKNTAIFSPGFLIRNGLSSGFTNYLADGFRKSLRGYRDYLTVLSTADDTRKIGKYTIKELRENILPRFGITGGGYVGQQVGEATGKISSKVEPVFRWWRDVNSAHESAHRGAMFLNAIRDGVEPLKAAQKVKKFHFDYRDLTPSEEWIKNKAIPFYAWTRNNIPLQLEMLFNAPTKYRNLAYLKQAVSGGQYDENVPDWWSQQDVWQTKFKDKEGNNIGISVGLPYADLNMLAGNPAGMLGPAGTVYNTLSNNDHFLNRPIQKFKGEKKPILTVGNTKIDQIPILNNPKVLYALEGLAPILKRYGTDLSAELSGIFTGEGKPDDKYRAAAKFLGVRVLPNIKSDAEKRKVLMLLQTLREYKQYQEQENQ